MRERCFGDYYRCSFATLAYKNFPVREETWQRLRAYKMGGATFDEVVKDLLDSVPLEEVSEEVIREHKRRMRSRKGWKDWREVRKSLGDDWRRAHPVSDCSARRPASSRDCPRMCAPGSTSRLRLSRRIRTPHAQVVTSVS